ncbi:DUF6807 family protein [Microbacterium sp. MPKO10]|uniref:DUF6807 family protein n=1 Tax=Microbacterium sp. MPKO10 TaxID=2989818 RepID=UPI002235944A|nr:DUF6807 family protein [Microbacterium sp. MPKO10]MCW4456970.1 PmoA family protein [Microbacterium sp. MPKO10]
MSQIPAPPSIVLVGGRGFGAHHLVRLREREAAGTLRLAVIADPAIAAEQDAVDGTPVVATLDAALELVRPDIVIIATPIGTHAALCETALRAGADILLEKPPVATFADMERLLAIQRETGRAIQVGFQSLGSHALPALADPALGLGSITRVSATGLWSRPLAYWKRSRWAGKRVLDGKPVVDGVATNPLAHAIATALNIAGLRTADDVASVETELYRANDIDSDDTSLVRISGHSGTPVTCALTICASPSTGEDRGASVTIEGTEGVATFSYTTDVLTLGDKQLTFGRTELIDNLLAHRNDGTPLLVPLEQTGAFMRVLEAIRTSPEPTKIPPEFVTWHDTGDDAYPVVMGIEAAVREAARTGSTFSELGVPWAYAARDSILSTISVAGTDVAEYRDGAATIPFSSPRPYLHEIRTRGGIVVSAQHPADHDWHLGLGFAVQDANSVNFWGGRTYMPDRGYVDRRDRGRIIGDALRESESGFEQELTWLSHDQSVVLRQQLAASWRALDGRAWALDLDITLLPPGDRDVTLGSPGSKGRTGAGYGGLFWRLPACRDARVFTADAEGEDAVNGIHAPWVAWTAEFLAQPEHTGTATIALVSRDAEPDPWFVRLADYPGIGSAVAWDTPTVVPAGAGLRRRYTALVADGAPSTPEVGRMIEGDAS